MRRIVTGVTAAFIAAVTSVAVPSRAEAAPIYLVETDQDPFGPLKSLTGSTAVELPVPAPFGGSAKAGPSGLATSVTASRTVGPDEHEEGGAGAALFLTDVVFTGPGPTVEAILNLHLTGSLAATASGGLAESAVFVLAGLTTDVEMLTLVLQIDCSTTSGCPVPMVDTVVSHNLGPVPVDVPISLGFALGSNIDFFGRETGGTFTGSSDFLHTLTFAAGPVFTLPAGYSVNSPDGSIVDNRFVPVESPVPVPEPATFMLFITGSIAGVIRARRRAH